MEPAQIAEYVALSSADMCERLDAPARVAQEAEQGTCNAQAVGSTPTSGSGDPASCGHPNPVWYADCHLWNEVMTGSRDGESPAILCPSCFADRADRHFAETPGNWRIIGWRMVPDWSRA